MTIDINLRNKTFEKVENYAKGILEGKITKNINDIEKEIEKEYLQFLNKYAIPAKRKKVIAKEVAKKDIENAIELIQKGF